MPTRFVRPVAFALALALTLGATAAAQAQQAPPRDTTAPPPAKPADVASVDAILNALYDVISGPAGQKRDWNRMRSLFAPGARLIPTGRRPDGAGSRAVVWTVEDYISRAGASLEQNGFFEKEIARKTEQYGNIVHAFSTYESRRTPQEAPFVRGINSIQLLKDGGRYWVVSIFWDDERGAGPIPAQYLPPR